MFVFSEYQTGTIDLSLSFYGYEECAPDYSFGPAIRDTYVLHYITKGRGKFHYNGKIVSLKAGDFFLLKPDELTFYQADSQNPWAYYWLGISGGKAPDYFAHSQISDQSYLIQSEICHTQTTAKLIADIVHFAQITKSNELAQLHIMGQLHELMFHLGSIAPNQRKQSISSTHHLYLDCKRFIDSHYPKAITIQDIAKELSVHRSYLTSVFKEFHQLSPKEYLLYVRMHRAKQLLEHTEESIKVIAYSVGFSDPLHFSKAYKQYFHKTPSQTRKELSQSS
ncbi:AraC family transcriptional regulator [Streptococcus oralis]|uniref:MSM (Multiple sugar metabolism) operon regulatory protein n=1 Tax=Streptococcus oralis TaxID=1303 RepID=A0A139P9U8_STROR|nr:AraC family ligand binding domain-containing protein [Streptococcus oralis]KXT84854.1 MSM (multiple sugar metabolism) operon regulatory protein [Streptococcus oralis]